MALLKLKLTSGVALGTTLYVEEYVLTDDLKGSFISVEQDYDEHYVRIYNTKSSMYMDKAPAWVILA
jgi:hypothetical protein